MQTILDAQKHISKQESVIVELETQDKNLRKLFIEKYKLGHGPKNIMVLIDPENKLGVSQTKYGTLVAEQLIKDGAITQRKGQSLEHKAYTDKKTKTTDLDIEKIAKIYDKSPSGSFDNILTVEPYFFNKFISSGIS